MSIKVVYILPSLEFGGAERSVLDLIAHSNLQVVDPVLLTFKTLAPFLDGAACKAIYLEDLGVREADLGLVVSRLHIPLAFLLARRIAARLKQENADVVVGVLHVGAFLVAQMKRFFSSRAKAIANLHGPATAYFQSEGRRGFRRAVEKACVTYMCKRADCIIVPSEGIREDLALNFRVAPGKIRTVYNGVDVGRVQSLSTEPLESPWFNGEVPVILGVGRLAPEKRFDTLVQAFAALKGRVKARLVIVGEGPLRGELADLARRMGVADDVALVGFQDNPFAYMRRSTVLVLSSSFEGFGNVLVEAMACGLPVIATDCPTGPGEIIHDGRNGLLVPVGDPIAMGHAICRVLTEQGLRERLIRGGLERAEFFSIERTAQEYERACLSLVTV